MRGEKNLNHVTEEGGLKTLDKMKSAKSVVVDGDAVEVSWQSNGLGDYSFYASKKKFPKTGMCPV